MPESSFSLSSARIVIIGLGLMGGSLAYSLKEHCYRLSALDSDQPTLELARRMEIVHAVGNDPGELISDADLVILACPVPDILKWIDRLPEYIQHPCIVVDIGSSKREIIKAFEDLPANFNPIGGHPICGGENLSLTNARHFLFRDSPFVLTPLARSDDNARQAALQLIDVIDAYPVWLNADEHDLILASTSHQPYLISSALALAIPQDTESLIGPGLRSSLRLAGTPSSMMLGVLLSNRDYVIAALQSFQEQLSLLESVLQENDSIQLKTILDNAQNKFQSLIG
ncbi:MAG: prephenate dehydrogenase [Anaerolineales bacterium]|nr:prephenate dehydrogenase [Anaerolineales bacterium]